MTSYLMTSYSGVTNAPATPATPAPPGGAPERGAKILPNMAPFERPYIAVRRRLKTSKILKILKSCKILKYISARSGPAARLKTYIPKVVSRFNEGHATNFN